MAFDLRAKFKVEDEFSPKIKRATKEVKRMSSEVKKINQSLTTMNNSVKRATSSINRMAQSIRKATTQARTLSRSFRDIDRNARRAASSSRSIRIPNVNRNFSRYMRQSNEYIGTMAREARALNTQLNRVVGTLRRVVQLTRQSANNIRSMNNNARNLTQSINRASTSANRLSASFRQAEQSARRLRETSSRINVNGGTQSVGMMKNQVAGLITLLGSALGITQTLNTTIGGAARFEASSVLIEAMFDDKKASDAYVKMLEKMAADSPVLNSMDMFAGSKSFISLSKDAKILKEAWKTVEKLTVMDPIQGVEGAVLAMRELAGGDVVSLAERFEMPRKALNEIKGLDFKDQVKALQELLAEMNITDDVVKKMGSTTSAQWNQFKEKMEMSLRNMGNTANSEIGKALQKVNEAMDGGGLDKIVAIGDKILGKTISGLIDGFGALATAFERIRNSKMVETIGNIKKAFDNIMAGNEDGAVSILQRMGLNPEQIQSVIDSVNMVKDGVASAFDWIKEKGKELSDFFVESWPAIKQTIADFWVIAQPILQGFWSILQTVGMIVRDVFENIVMPLLKAAKAVFEDLWTVVGPILKFLGETFKFMADSIKTSYENTISPIISGFKTAAQQLDSVVMPILGGISKAFSAIGDAAKWAADKMGIAISKGGPKGNPYHKPKTVKPPKSFRQPKYVPRTIADPGRPGFATGLERVPYDNFPANLHRDESVLTAQQSETLRKLGVLKSNGKRPVLDTSSFSSSNKSSGTKSAPVQPQKGNTYKFGDIHIHGAQKTTKEMARELVRNIEHVINTGVV